jgi:precorrin-3B C17-methyltransferase
LIEQRLEAVGLADLVVALYNPASGRRQTQLPRAREILLRHRGEATPVGVVRDAGRPGQTVVLTDLGHLLATPIDMHTVVLVGNRTTLVQGGRMITPRGYPPPETADQPRKDAPMTLVDGEDGSLEPLRAAASQWKGIGS